MQYPPLPVLRRASKSEHASEQRERQERTGCGRPHSLDTLATRPNVSEIAWRTECPAPPFIAAADAIDWPLWLLLMDQRSDL